MVCLLNLSLLNGLGIFPYNEICGYRGLYASLHKIGRGSSARLLNSLFSSFASLAKCFFLELGLLQRNFATSNNKKSNI